MEKLNHLRITLVFIVTIIIPSLFLSAFAYQAVEAERVARRMDERRRLSSEASDHARDLDALVRAPAREVREQVARLRGQLGRLQDAAALLRSTSEQAPVGSLALFALDGRRVYPATPGAPPCAPAAAAAMLGGSAFLMATAPEAAQILREAADALGASTERPGDVRHKGELAARATEKLLRLEVGASLATRTAAKLQLSRLHAASNEEGELAVASYVLDRIARTPIDLVDPLGRPVAAQARLDGALVARSMRRPELFRARLVALLAELERSPNLVAAEDLARLATRAAELLDSEGKDYGEVVRRANEAALARRQSEARQERLDDLFGADVRELLRTYERRPRLARGDDPLAGPATKPPSAASDAIGDEDPSHWFARRRAGERDWVLLLAPVYTRDGALAGVATFPYDVERLVPRLDAHQPQDPPDGATTFEVVTARIPGDEGPGTARAPLAAPFDQVQVVARGRRAPEEVLWAERTTMKLWLIALSIGGIAAGAVVTTRTVLREAKAAELKSDFVTNVTHELRTPLTSIRMFIETLEHGRVEDEAEAKECLQIMGRETDRLTRLIERLLAFSKIESRKWRFKFSYVAPQELVDEAIRLLRRQLQLRDDAPLPIEVESIQALKPIAVDKDAIVEVLLNLLTNAWKYTPAENRRIKIVLSERRRQVVVDVEDNGIGVPRRDRRRIWKKFERGSNAEKGRIEGSGIGLTLALSIAKGHGGTIALTPLKQGSRFSLLLPKV